MTPQLIDDMRKTANRHPDKPLMVRHDDHWEPLLCVIPVAHKAVFENAWHEGERSPGRVMRKLGATALRCPTKTRGWPISTPRNC